MEITRMDWESTATQRLIWRAELSELKESVFRAEVEARAEFNIWLATVSAGEPEPCECSGPHDNAVARRVEAQLQDWGLALWELKVMAAHAEESATDAYDALLKAVLISGDPGAAPVAFRHQERAADIAALRMRTARAATDVREAYSRLLAALHTKSAMAREKRRSYFNVLA
jgi:hypothetical protein